MLTDKAIQSFKPGEKPYKKFDANGLFLLIYPNGKKGWRFKYKFGGREKGISFGSYPDTSLKLARDKRDKARQDLAADIDPSAKRREEKASQENSFEVVARDWLKRQKTLSDSTIRQLRQRMDSYLIPSLGRHPISKITAQDILRVLRRIESRGTHETALRVRSLSSRIFRYAIATGKADRDPAADLRGALTPAKTKNFAAITNPKRIGELLRAIDHYQGQPGVMAALKLAPLVFVRPGELRAAEWVEFDLDAGEWRIPADRMKMDREHVVPLSTQALEILEDLRAITGRGTRLFPSLRSAARPISDNTLNAALRRLGFSKDEMTTHGFRTMASTHLNELGFPPDVIELQLAHKEKNKVRAAYNRAEHIQLRREMMQAWADYLDGLKADKRARISSIGEGSRSRV